MTTLRIVSNNCGYSLKRKSKRSNPFVSLLMNFLNHSFFSTISSFFTWDNLARTLSKSLPEEDSTSDLPFPDSVLISVRTSHTSAARSDIYAIYFCLSEAIRMFLRGSKRVLLLEISAASSTFSWSWSNILTPRLISLRKSLYPPSSTT